MVDKLPWRRHLNSNFSRGVISVDAQATLPPLAQTDGNTMREQLEENGTLVTVFQHEGRHDGAHGGDLATGETGVRATLEELVGVVRFRRARPCEYALHDRGGYIAEHGRIDGLPIGFTQPGFTAFPEAQRHLPHNHRAEQGLLVALPPYTAVVFIYAMIDPERSAGDGRGCLQQSCHGKRTA
jgi:hypothetical protein